MAAHHQPQAAQGHGEGEGVGGERQVTVVRSATDLQRLKLDKLMKNPDKLAFIPDRPKDKKFSDPAEFVRNVMGSSAGAGSGEFHVYRHIRRREYARQEFLQNCKEKITENIAMFEDWDDLELLDQLEEMGDEIDGGGVVGRRRRRIVTDRMNPFTAMSDGEFIDRFRLRKASMFDLIEEIRDHLPTPHDLRGCPVPPHLQTLIAIRCMASGDQQITLGDCHEVSQTTVSQCLRVVSRAIASLSRQYIKPPSGNDLQQTIQDFHDMRGMPGVVGAIDCTHIAILRPSGDNSEVFRCRKGFFSLNVQAVCGPDLRFHNVVARWPGSVHDSRIFYNSRLCADIEANLNPRYHLLGDAGYALKRYLLTPVSVPASAQERRYNKSHSSTRNVIERAFGVLKMRFGCLGKKLKTKLDTTKGIIVAAMVLHNIAVQTRLVLPEDGYDLVNIDDNVPVQGEVNIQGRIKRQQIIRDFF